MRGAAVEGPRRPRRSCGPGRHEWGDWLRGRTRWRRICEVCSRVEREDRNERVLSAKDLNAYGSTQIPDAGEPDIAAEGIHRIADTDPSVVIEAPPWEVLKLSGRTEARRRFMDSHPGVWIRWARGLIGGPPAAHRLRGLGYDARSQRMPDGTFTVWSRLPDSSG